MQTRFKHDPQEVREKILRALEDGCKPIMSRVADHIGIPATTMRDALKRGYGVTTIPDLLGADLREPEKEVLGWSGVSDEITDTTDGNVRTIISYSKDLIKTLDDLVRVKEINLNEWIVTNRDERSWTTPMKLKKNIGSEDRPIVISEAAIVQNYYVSVRLIPKKPEPITPVIVPIDLLPTVKMKKARKGGKIKRALLAGDFQMGYRRRLHTEELVPFHDRRVMDIILQILQMEDFDNVTLAGDVNDLSEWSDKFTTEPEFYWTTQPMLIEQAWWLEKYRLAAPAAEIDYHEGNHDKRMEKLMVSHMKAAYGLRAADELELPPAMSVPRLLALHSLDINYIDGYPDNKKWMNNNVAVMHGDMVRAGAGDTAKAFVHRRAYTSIFFHVHRREMVARKVESHNGHQIHIAFCPGCCCHIDGRTPGSKSDDQWQQGIAVMEYTEDFENLIPVAIDEGRAIYKGQEVIARELDDQLDDMLRKKLREING